MKKIYKYLETEFDVQPPLKGHILIDDEMRWNAVSRFYRLVLSNS